MENLQKGLVFGRRAGKKEGNYHIEKKVWCVRDCRSSSFKNITFMRTRIPFWSFLRRKMI